MALSSKTKFAHSARPDKQKLNTDSFVKPEYLSQLQVVSEINKTHSKSPKIFAISIIVNMRIEENLNCVQILIATWLVTSGKILAT